MAVIAKSVLYVHLLTVARSPVAFTAGEEIEAGDVVYMALDGKVYKADNTSAAKANALGVVVSGRASDGKTPAGRPVDVAFDGLVSGFSGTPGTVAYVGTTAGTLEDAPPAAGSGKYKFAVGVVVPEGLMLRPAAEPVQV